QRAERRRITLSDRRVVLWIGSVGAQPPPPGESQALSITVHRFCATAWLVAPDTTTVATVVRLDQQARISCIGQVDPRLAARVEALCDRAATLASQTAALSMEAARLRAEAESTLRLLPCGRDSGLGSDAENWLRVLPGRRARATFVTPGGGC